MYIYVCIHAYIDIYIHTYTYTYIYAWIYIYMYICKYVYIYIYVQLDIRLSSMHTTGKMSWDAATRSIRECKMRIERIRRSCLDTDSEVWGPSLDQTTWKLMWARDVAVRKSIPALRKARYECISNLPRIQKSYGSPRKWQKCNLVLGDRLCGQRHGLASNWVDLPRTSADERMLSGRRFVVIV